MSQITATYIDHMGSDLSVVNAARVSFGKKSEWDGVTETCRHISDMLLQPCAVYVTPVTHNTRQG